MQSEKVSNWTSVVFIMAKKIVNLLGIYEKVSFCSLKLEKWEKRTNVMKQKIVCLQKKKTEYLWRKELNKKYENNIFFKSGKKKWLHLIFKTHFYSFI